MKRILHIADLHLSRTATIAGAVRLDDRGNNLAVTDTFRAVRQIVEAAQASGPLDGIAVAGDLSDHAGATPAEEVLFAALFDYLGPQCVATRALLIPGNHDLPRNPGEPSACSPLAWHPRVLLVEDPRVVEYAGLRWACLPYPRRSAWRESLPAEAEITNEGISGAITTCALAMRTEGAQVLLAHATIGGATVGRQPRTIEGDIEVGREALEAFGATMLGHIHKQQAIGTARYSGSPTCQDFGEEGEPKGGLVWTFSDSGDPVSVEAIGAEVRRWETIDVAPAEGTAAFRWTRNLTTLDRGTAYRVRGELPADALSSVRETLAAAIKDGAFVQDELRLLVEDRARDRDIGREGIDEAEVLGRALASRQVPETDHPRLIDLHKSVQQGVSR